MAWLLKFLNKEEFIDFEAEDALSDLDEYIYNYAVEEIDRGNYDFCMVLPELCIILLREEV